MILPQLVIVKGKQLAWHQGRWWALLGGGGDRPTMMALHESEVPAWSTRKPAKCSSCESTDFHMPPSGPWICDTCGIVAGEPIADEVLEPPRHAHRNTSDGRGLRNGRG